MRKFIVAVLEITMIFYFEIVFRAVLLATLSLSEKRSRSQTATTDTQPTSSKQACEEKKQEGIR